MAPTRKGPIIADFPADLTGEDFAARLNEELAALWNYIDMPLTSIGGTANAIIASSVVPMITNPVAGMRVTFTPTASNDNAATINIDARGLYAIKTADNAALIGGELVIGRATSMWFDGTAWRLDPVGWTTIRKVANQAKSSDTTLALDSALQFALAANRKYAFRGMAFFDAVATPGFKYAFTGPASPTLIQIERRSRAPNSTSFAVAGDAGYTASTAITGSATDHGHVSFDGIIHNGANPGAFGLQWAQNTSNASAVTVKAGSYIEYMQF